MAEDTKQLLIMALAIVVLVVVLAVAVVHNSQISQDGKADQIAERTKACQLIEDPTQRIVCVQTAVRP
jgi:hypothetical protein